MFKLFTLKAISAIWGTAIIPLATYKLWWTTGNNLIIGNYQSYIDPEIAEEWTKKNIQFDYFESDKRVPNSFKNGIYDASIVSNSTLSELIEKQLVKPIDWSKLGLKKNDKSTDIKNSNDAKEIFTEKSKKSFTDDNKYLQYGVPYFLSTFSFYYRGPKITGLESKKSWSDIFKEIAKDERFKTKDNQPQIAAIDDARTIYSMGKLLNGDSNLNLENGKTGSLSEMKETFSKLGQELINKNTLGNKTIFLNSDSSIVLDMLSKKTVNGAFMYNGDAVFSLNGGNSEISISKDDFHTVTPDKSIFLMDFLAISKTITPEKEEKLYEFIKQLFFEGHSDDDMLKKEDETYSFMPAKNFDFVYYTPTLKKFMDKLKTTCCTEGENNELKKKILLIDDCSSDNSEMFEGYLKNDATSNMHIAYEEWKNNL